MRASLIGFFAVVLGMVAPSPATPQGLVTQRNLSLPMAKTIAEAALAACKQKGFNTAVAVVDRDGRFATVFVNPDRPAEVREQRVSTNHQHGVEWARHAQTPSGFPGLRSASTTNNPVFSQSIPGAASGYWAQSALILSGSRVLSSCQSFKYGVLGLRTYF